MKMQLWTLSTGDVVHRYDKSIVVIFQKPRKVLSTSVLNGGYREDLKAVFNHDSNPGAGMACALKAPTYAEHMLVLARELGLDPAAVTGMGTAASMDNAAIATLGYEALTVTAIVTGGIEVNGGRVGDPASHFQPVDKQTGYKLGTINIMLIIDADLPPGILARALVTCTEAKTAALQELMAGSNYSTGLATGSGTDQSIVIANPQSALYLESAGKHSKLGELIGRTVKQAVKEALARQNGLTPQRQHSVLRRTKRYGLTSDSLWQLVAKRQPGIWKAEFMHCLEEWECSESAVTYVSLYIHLLDQLAWGLLSPAEVQQAGQRLLTELAQVYGVAVPTLPLVTEASVGMQCLETMIADNIAQCFGK